MGTVETFCCCLSLRTGVIIIGILGLVGSFFQLVAAPFYDRVFIYFDSSTSKEFVQSAFIIRIISGSISLVTHVLLLVGVNEKKKGFLIPWLVMSFIGCLLISLSFFIVVYSLKVYTDQSIRIFIVTIITIFTFCVLSWYFWLCVWNYFLELSSIQPMVHPSVEYKPAQPSAPPAYNPDVEVPTSIYPKDVASQIC